MMKIKSKQFRISFMLFLLSFVSLSAFAQEITVKGTVTDEGGFPLPSVSIMIVGTSTGTVSDFDGNYTIAAPSDGALEFNFIGFSKQVVQVSGQTKIDVTLREDLMRLDEVVVVGYGVQRKSDITGSITSVDVGAIRNVASSSVIKSLQGKTAGVEIQNIGTNPGASAQIRIRGNRSLTASNDPLLIVDGIPFSGSLNDIATDDIESFEILKDASATVIYGSRGSNGVIIVTTKRGQAGKTRVTYNGYAGLSKISKYYDVYDGQGFAKLRDDAGNSSDWLPHEIESLMNGRETNWQDIGFKSGFVNSHEVGLNGGDEKTTYSMSIGTYDESYIISQMNYNRNNVRISVDHNVTDWLKVGMSTMNSMAITDGESSGTTWGLVSLSPLAAPYNADGSLVEQPVYGTDDTYSPLTLNDLSRWGEQRRVFSSFNTGYIQADIWNGIKYRLNAGADFRANKYNKYNGSNTPFKNGGQNSAILQNQDNFAWTVENMILWDKQIGAHRISFTGMQSAEKSTNTSSRFEATDVAADYLQYNNFYLADVVQAANNNNYFSEWRLLSFMARVNYGYLDKYMVTLTGRTDGSSRLAKGNKWHSYPAVALAWNANNESFLQDVDFLTQLKVRLGYGQTSNTSIDPYRTLGNLGTVKYTYADAGVTGYYVTRLPNPRLGWEYTTSYNAGIDFGFFGGRLAGSVDAYLQQTNDLLLDKRLPSTTGITGRFLENIGKTENRGLEFVVNGAILTGRNSSGLKWDVSANAFLNREKIVALQDGQDRDEGNGWFVGQPTTAIFDYVKLGIWQLGEETQAAVYGAKPGDLKIKDVNNDNQITPDDREIIGSQEPILSGGLSSTWEYKNFDLSVVSYFRLGGTIISTLHMPNDYLNRLDGRRNQIKVDYWTPNNPTNAYPAPRKDPGAYTNTLGYFDGTFLKIRSINLGYNFKNLYNSKTNLRVYASVADPFTLFSPYMKEGGVNPEPTSRAEYSNDSVGLPSRSLVISLSTPPTTRYIFGVNFSF